MPLHVGLDQVLVVLVVRKSMRTRADDGHAALQHVEELRQLIETGPTQKGTDAGDTRILALSLGHFAMGLLVHYHRAELVDLELLPVDAGTVLLEQHRAWRGDLDGNGDADTYRQNQQGNQAANQHVL
ncbi:hypothetical protein D3C80_1196190 [compost metagenome]